MQLTPTEALKRISVSADTLYKDMKRGKLSYEKKGSRKRLIDVAELERVYGSLRPEHEGPTSEDIDPDIGSDIGRMPGESPTKESATEIALLRLQVQILAEERRREREQTQEQIEDLKANLKNAQEHQTRLTALITDQRQEKDRKEAQHHALLIKELRQRQLKLEHELKERNRGFFSRWLGAGKLKTGPQASSRPATAPPSTGQGNM
ncbi:MAG: hypothetical protein Q8P46_14540 [Hyphomicrobiales bacterium]|nr:hypothetical protein [Hyphomicrobiales bacterium]